MVEPPLALAFGSLKMAYDAASSLLKLKVSSDVQSKVIELQGEIFAAQQNALTAQADQSALTQRISELETEIAQSKSWDAEKQNYELSQVSPGAFAFVLKPDAKGASPPHWLCPTCFENGRKSIIQRGSRHSGRGGTNWLCAQCKNIVVTGWNSKPE